MPEQTVNIDIPGFTDIIKLPGIENVQIRKERAIRMKSKLQAQPAWEGMVTSALTMLDDIEDQLSVAIELGKPFLRRLPGRMIPYVGWAITAADAIDLATTLLGIAELVPTGKAEFRKRYQQLAAGRKARIPAIRQELSHTRWGNVIIEGAQVLETWTGYGLSLGPIWGMLSDAVWSAIKAVQGDANVVVRGPPARTFAEKSYWVAIQAGLLQPFNMLAKGDWDLVHAAANVASGEITATPPTGVTPAQHDESADWFTHSREPWNDATKQALVETLGAEFPPAPLNLNPAKKPVYQEAMKQMKGDWLNIVKAYQTAHAGIPGARVQGMMAEEAAAEHINRTHQ